MNNTTSIVLAPTAPRNLTQPSSPFAEEYAKLAVQVVIAFIGVLGNISALLAFGRQVRKRSTTDFYICVLSAADLLVLSVNFPIAVMRVLLPTNWPLGKFVCIYLFPIPETFYGVSVSTITAIAIERYRGIVLGQAVRGNHSIGRAKRTTAVLWGLSFAVFSLPLYFVMNYEASPTFRLCGPKWPPTIFKVYMVVLLVLSYAGPLACICCTYVGVHRSLKRSNSFIKTMFDGRDVTLQSRKVLSRTEQKRLQENRRAHRILTPIIILFAVSMFPLTALRTLVAFFPSLWPTPFKDFYFVAVVGAIANSAGNPVIYAFSSEHFREGLKELVLPQRKRSGSTSSVQATSTV